MTASDSLLWCGVWPGDAECFYPWKRRPGRAGPFTPVIALTRTGARVSYFIAATYRGIDMVKIGRSVNPFQRWRDIRYATRRWDEEPKLIAVSSARERDLHRLFVPHRLDERLAPCGSWDGRGSTEWFRALPVCLWLGADEYMDLDRAPSFKRSKPIDLAALGRAAAGLLDVPYTPPESSRSSPETPVHGDAP